MQTESTSDASSNGVAAERAHECNVFKTNSAERAHECNVFKCEECGSINRIRIGAHVCELCGQEALSRTSSEATVVGEWKDGRGTMPPKAAFSRIWLL